MNQPRAEQTFSSQNITAELLLDTYSVGTITESYDLEVHLLLGRTGGLIQGQGSTYTIELEIVRTISATSETFRIAKQIAVIGGSGTTKKLFILKCKVNSGDQIKVYATSSNASDTAVHGAVWYYNTADVYNGKLSAHMVTSSIGEALNLIRAWAGNKMTMNYATGSMVLRNLADSGSLKNFLITTALGIDTRTPV